MIRTVDFDIQAIHWLNPCNISFQIDTTVYNSGSLYDDTNQQDYYNALQKQSGTILTAIEFRKSF